MNYVHHAVIGVGTAALGVLVVESLGAPRISFIDLGLGAVAVAAGSIATDLDHPRSFISNTIPSRLLRLALAVLAIPALAALATWFTTRDLPGTLGTFGSLVWRVGFLRWAAAGLFGSLVLMLLSLALYKNLHHRGPLHSLVFTHAVMIIACILCALAGAPWVWGLAFGWGWLWHVLADGLTEQGVPLYWPFNDDRRHTLPRWACKIGAIILTVASFGGMVGLALAHIFTPPA